MTHKIEKHSVGLTITILAASAAFAGLAGLSIAFLAAVIPLTASGPIGWMIGFPLLLTQFASAVTWVLIGVPVIALGVGFLIASGTSGRNGAASRAFNVTFFDDAHPIKLRMDELAADLNIPPVPYVGWYPSPSINAFAMGTEHINTIVAFTDTAVKTLSKEELNAIMAHELAHVANNDMKRMTIARSVQEALTFFLIFRGLKKIARWVFSPIGEIEILRLSRQREYAADNISAHLTSPKAMMAALEAIDKHERATNPDYANVQINGTVKGLFRTHPPIPQRLKALQTVKTAPSKTPEKVCEHQKEGVLSTDDVTAHASH